MCVDGVLFFEFAWQSKQRAIIISAADLSNNSLTAERTLSDTAGNVIVHGFGDSCAILAALS